MFAIFNLATSPTVSIDDYFTMDGRHFRNDARCSAFARSEVDLLQNSHNTPIFCIFEFLLTVANYLRMNFCTMAILRRVGMAWITSSRLIDKKYVL